MRPSLRIGARLVLGLTVMALAAVTAGPAVAAAAPADCTPDRLLVNPCRPWLGARATGYPDVAGNERAQIEYHEQRIGRKIDLPHTYSPGGSLPLTDANVRYLAQRPDTYLFQNWKAADRWRDAGGGNATVNARIDQAAENIKKLGTKKIFLTLHHEPENDVTYQAGCKTKAGASGGTPAEYRQMWANVRKRFDAKGVSNVVWVMDYMNYPTWDCLVPHLYPGDQYVDWIMFNAYGASWNPSFEANVDRFQKILEKHTTPARKLTSKPWGIVEWGITHSTAAEARSYYQQAYTAMENNRFPKLKAYMIFDSPGFEPFPGLRIRYTDSGQADLREQDLYKRFASHPRLQ
ncbi:glycosyl hydrolase [Longispora albida]|uniref:glycosyl hydrolase n=1 Tax=Longispora albida TaxID=203523 RepID=UPI0003626245|nr:glycosyl hydrolase [Longispora albida]